MTIRMYISIKEISKFEKKKKISLIVNVVMLGFTCPKKSLTLFTLLRISSFFFELNYMINELIDF